MYSVTISSYQYGVRLAWYTLEPKNTAARIATNQFERLLKTASADSANRDKYLCYQVNGYFGCRIRLDLKYWIERVHLKISGTPSFDNTYIVIPTYNESHNISLLVEEIVSRYNRPDVYIWVIDDNSPDGTAGVVRGLGKKYLNVQVLVRESNRGYGSSVAEGMRAALAAGAQWVLTMDADFAHSPAVIGQMLEAAMHADLVIGSRYAVDGSPAVQDWPLWRLLMSRFGNWYFRFMLKVTARDNTSGFRCWGGAFLTRILAEDLQATGYAFLTETLFYAGRFSGRITEVTNLYLGRTRGESKLSPKILLESLWTAFRLGVLTRHPRAVN
jgi:dolichol-phosphate mannosyltransferase